MSALAQTPTFDPHPPAPTRELGAETQQVGGIAGWASFIDEQEYVPELSWPASIQTYHRMRSDSQVEALHLGTVQPVREFRWSIDPNRAPAALAEQAAADLGLPIRGQEDDAIGRGPRLFDFDQFLDDALPAPLYGHMLFEIVGDVQADGWHMQKLAPRHPRTIMEFQADRVGDLLGIRQNVAGAGGFFQLPPLIPAGKLIQFVWRKEAGSHVGRAQLRSLYREWLVKDRTIRVAAINVQRGNGVPIIEGPQGASDEQLRDLAVLARSFKVAEGGGGAIPYGSKLTLAGGHVPDAISLLEYCDACMARVWSLMLIQLGLGSTSSGNRALGGEFALYAARAQRAVAKWVCRSVNDFLDRYTEWNLGPDATHAPLLHYEQDKPDSMSVAEFVQLVEAQALTVDPELESWLRNEHGLPAYTPPTDPTLGDLTPEEVALVQNSRTPLALPSPSAPPDPNDVQRMQTQTIASTGLDTITLALPDRTLRRQPTQNEMRARVNLRQMDASHQAVFGALSAAFTTQVIPGQIQALGDQILNTKQGTPRKVLTKDAMTSITAPVTGQDLVDQHLLQAAQDGADAALGEMSAQGIPAQAPTDDTLQGRLRDQSAALVAMTAGSLSLSAQRKAASLVGGGRTPGDVQAGVEAYLAGLSQQWVGDQLRGAITYAQNIGRATVFETADQTAIRYYSSEILDVNTCDACATVDGTEYESLQDAENDYAAGGYVDCAGGPRCRGTLIAVGIEQTSSSESSLALADLGAG